MRTIVLIAVLAAPLPAFGQFPYQPYSPYVPVVPPPPPPPPGPREKRAAREAAVAKVGPEARGLVEAYGEPAVEALNAVSRPVGKTLAECYSCGALSKTGKPSRFAPCDRRAEL